MSVEKEGTLILTINLVKNVMKIVKSVKIKIAVPNASKITF